MQYDWVGSKNGSFCWLYFTVRGYLKFEKTVHNLNHPTIHADIVGGWVGGSEKCQKYGGVYMEGPLCIFDGFDVLFHM